MPVSKYKHLLHPLLAKPFFHANHAKELGIPARMLSHFCDQGLIERISRGYYRNPNLDTGLDFALDELALTAASIPDGVICLISALYYYEMTDQIMREYWIAVPNSDRGPKRPLARIVRMRNMQLGVAEMKMGDYNIKIFDRERTVVDSFRYLSQEIAIKALQAYLKSKPDMNKLSDYAKILRVNLTPYIMALTT